ncbi:hypothetical protein BHE90_007525 [Fusarium euwallaceae]|uniref:Uncharacterized protein n=4 Tax=Fusarium solani species complex TaxID=232080 RepID=A0A3M2S896_9HYPO|nr:hypothetical protein CDV36_006594 [Fusarium kuroshium]RSL75959.1 hypothetical protein CEP51_010399 [Fusarium floridanum]RSL95881.1 hypothetical protein CEP52_011819 [Fusarium oligoseptatum]RTE77991.1 hypothetical protein BHE90_007525 [Fusarium euwallaceae]
MRSLFVARPGPGRPSEKSDGNCGRGIVQLDRAKGRLTRSHTLDLDVSSLFTPYLFCFFQCWLAAVSLYLLPARDDRVEKTSENAFNDRAVDRHVKQQQRSIRSSSSI